MLNWQNIFGQCTSILITTLPILEQYILFKTNIISQIKCSHGYPDWTPKYITITWIDNDSCEMLNPSPPLEGLTAKKCTLYKYAENNRQQSNEGFEFPPDEEHTFST